MPSIDVVGKTGAGSPAQIGDMGLKVVVYIGSDKSIPLRSLLVLPPAVKKKLEYTPAFKPLIVKLPLALLTIVTGPTGFPLSEYVT
jgi:hypothetical protein